MDTILHAPYDSEPADDDIINGRQCLGSMQVPNAWFGSIRARDLGTLIQLACHGYDANNGEVVLKASPAIRAAVLGLSTDAATRRLKAMADNGQPIVLERWRVRIHRPTRNVLTTMVPRFIGRHPDLSAVDVAVCAGLLCIAGSGQRMDGVAFCWLSVDALAARVGMGATQVRVALSNLESAGIVARRFREGRRSEFAIRLIPGQSELRVPEGAVSGASQRVSELRSRQPNPTGKRRLTPPGNDGHPTGKRRPIEKSVQLIVDREKVFSQSSLRERPKTAKSLEAPKRSEPGIESESLDAFLELVADLDHTTEAALETTSEYSIDPNCRRCQGTGADPTDPAITCECGRHPTAQLDTRDRPRIVAVRR